MQLASNTVAPAASVDSNPRFMTGNDTTVKKHMTKAIFTRAAQIAALGALAFLTVNISPAFAATFSRSADISGTLAQVWSMICPFCALKDWLPPVGTCTETGGSPSERTS